MVSKVLEKVSFQKSKQPDNPKRCFFQAKGSKVVNVPFFFLFQRTRQIARYWNSFRIWWYIQRTLSCKWKGKIQMPRLHPWTRKQWDGCSNRLVHSSHALTGGDGRVNGQHIRRAGPLRMNYPDPRHLNLNHHLHHRLLEMATAEFLSHHTMDLLSRIHRRPSVFFYRCRMSVRFIFHHHISDESYFRWNIIIFHISDDISYILHPTS